MARSAKARIRNEQAIEREIREAGLRATPARVAVLSTLRTEEGPRTHSEVCDALRGRRWDKATIFRNLVTLAEEGFLHRTDLGDHVWRFEATLAQPTRGEVHEHPHFLCTDCGAVACIPELELRVRATPGLPRAVRERAVQVQLKGRCDACAG